MTCCRNRGGGGGGAEGALAVGVGVATNVISDEFLYTLGLNYSMIALMTI